MPGFEKRLGEVVVNCLHGVEALMKRDVLRKSIMNVVTLIVSTFDVKDEKTIQQ